MTAADKIEHLGREIARLVAERQALRATAADPVDLERNRLEICTVQQRLADAFIARYLPARAHAA